MTESMIERVAKAMRRQWNIDNFDRTSEVGWEDEINAARAAIEAMRQPTAAMVDAMNEHAGSIAPEYAWSDAIGAALNEQVAG